MPGSPLRHAPSTIFLNSPRASRSTPVGSWVTGSISVMEPAVRDGLHEGVGCANGDVEIVDLPFLSLAVDELLNVRVVNAHDGHVGAVALAALGDHRRDAGEVAQDGDGPAGLAVGGLEMWAPFWRRLDRGTPVPPPNFCTMAMSDAVFMMADMLSSKGRTKQAERVPASVPAFIIVGELGRNSRRAIMR